MNEFDFIRDVLAPLSGEGAFGLTDDAAMLPGAPDGWVVTADMLVEGRHFLTECPIETVGRKALRVNLSDLVAKGARPVSYLLSVAWPAHLRVAARTRFAEGLGEDQNHYGVSLLGGDTSATDGPLTVAVTAFGAPGPGGMVLRSGARPGHDIWLTGTIGDAGLGLRMQKHERPWKGADAGALTGAYRLPSPPVAFAGAIADLASAAADVSDGALADAGHIARASAALIELDLERLPLSPSAAAWVETQGDRIAALTELATSGDDYQVLLCALPEAETALAERAEAAGVRLTRIGRVCEGQGLRVLGGEAEIRPGRLGFTHF